MAGTKFIIWYAIWCNDEKMLVHLRKTKKGAKTLVRDLRNDFPGYKFGWKRLIEQTSKPRRKRRKPGSRQPKGEVIYPYGMHEGESQS